MRASSKPSPRSWPVGAGPDYPGGIGAAGGLIQRRMDLPDATVLLLQGVVFVTLLASETLYGRLPFFRTTQESRT